MQLLVMLVVGVVVGVLARLLVPARRGQWSLPLTLLLGFGGSLLGGLFARAVGWSLTPRDLTGIAASVIGASLLLFFYRLITERHQPVS
jgi:uncharacterized membrane protein YeaQ/YmgE (transglycosylase-associated protein family)